ncbi:Rv3654c family TadE-like protein [Glaciibacter sp. 2TAF33]|uniref:Rv3654c family TadE-like protein n=1 Tax=Glaciibacter sp. 2TAF33 TaxID=3233015 RepID=UPI003F9375A2
MRAGRGTVRLLDADRGSGSILGLAVIGVTMMLTALVVPACALLAVGQSVHNAADAAALAAADTASGAIGGVPCEMAAAAAALNGASVGECVVDGLIASVTVGRTVAGFDIVARARAGPPDG